MNHLKVFIAGVVVATWAWQLVAFYEKRHAYAISLPQVVACSATPIAGEQYCSCSNCAMKYPQTR